MARRWLTPSSACVVITSSCVSAGSDTYVWFSLVAPHNTTACATLYNTGTETASNALWTTTAAACTSTPMAGPFKTGGTVYVRLAGTGASAVVAKA